ncbi:hypothetical protein U1Q18_000231 [Sarracenia purpurea var. burkii]
MNGEDVIVQILRWVKQFGFAKRAIYREVTLNESFRAFAARVKMDQAAPRRRRLSEKSEREHSFLKLVEWAGRKDHLSKIFLSDPAHTIGFRLLLPLLLSLSLQSPLHTSSVFIFSIVFFLIG